MVDNLIGTMTSYSITKYIWVLYKDIGLTGKCHLFFKWNIFAATVRLPSREQSLKVYSLGPACANGINLC